MKTKSSNGSAGIGRTNQTGIRARRGRPPKNRKKLYRTPDLEGIEAEPSRGLIHAEQQCDYCSQSSLCNRKGVFESLLFCKDCTAKAHPSCMGYSEELSFRARKGLWQCIDCKTCCVCMDAGDAGLMLFCDGCDKGYHMNCHMPQVVEKPIGMWVCEECTKDGVKTEELERQERERDREQVGQRDNPPNLIPVSPPSIKQEPGSSLPLTPAASPSAIDAGARVPFDPAAGRKFLSKEPRYTGKEYPDATNWTVSDVADFLISAGFAEQAETFREQEVDGKTLLLLKRNDILKGMSFKLGPALKIHRHVHRLQMAGMKSEASAM